MKSLTLAGIAIVAVVALSAACGSGDSRDSGDGGGDELATSSVEDQIRSSIVRTYSLITDQRWEDLWQSYSSDFRDRCSYDDMIDVMEEIRSEGVTRFEVSSIRSIEYVGSSGNAAYVVVGFDDAGEQTASYDYEVDLVNENGTWLFEEVCF